LIKRPLIVLKDDPPIIPYEEKVKRLLDGAIKLKVFNVKELAREAGLTYYSAKKILNTFLMKDRLGIAFSPHIVKGIYEVVKVKVKK